MNRVKRMDCPLTIEPTKGLLNTHTHTLFTSHPTYLLAFTLVLVLVDPVCLARATNRLVDSVARKPDARIGTEILAGDYWGLGVGWGGG